MELELDNPETGMYFAPDDILDEDNPLNDPYYRSLARLRATIVQQATSMRPKHVQIARLIHQGKRNVEIAEQVKYTQSAISTIVKRPDVEQFLHTLRAIAAMLDGPNLELRKHMLWRIARTNEAPEPNTAITALKELNKLDGAYPQPDISTQPQRLEITINGQQMPRTQLDASQPDKTAE